MCACVKVCLWAVIWGQKMGYVRNKCRERRSRASCDRVIQSERA